MKAEKRRGQVEREGVPWEQLTLAQKQGRKMDITKK